jgi:transcriptional regulator with XRE-family HTH domain
MDLTLGERLTVARERCGLTKIEVAKIVLNPGAGKKPRSATIAAWERGTMGVSFRSLRRLTDLYGDAGGISPAWVILGDEPMSKSEP